MFWGLWNMSAGVMIPARSMPSDMIGRNNNNNNNVGVFGSSSSSPLTLSKVGASLFNLPLFWYIQNWEFMILTFIYLCSLFESKLQNQKSYFFLRGLTLKRTRSLLYSTKEAKYPSRYSKDALFTSPLTVLKLFSFLKKLKKKSQMKTPSFSTP